MIKMTSRDWHWSLCVALAVSVTGSTMILSLPVCIGCWTVQILLWIRLALSSKKAILYCLGSTTPILGWLWYVASQPILTCPFDAFSSVPKCHNMHYDFIGLPFPAWGLLGMAVLCAWAWSWQD